MTTVRTISDAARKVLARCQIEDDTIILPSEQLLRPLYEEVNSVLESLGGKWTRGRKAHVFEAVQGSDLADQFYTVVETGKFERPQDSGYYPTPEWLVERMIGAADVQMHHRVLEPSAGQGAILRPLMKKLASGKQLAICELLPANRKVLEEQGFIVDAEDFLTFDTGPMFDRIVANPPFGKSAAPIHVRHMIRLLKPGGRLVAIMPSGIVQRQDKLHREVRAELMRSGTVHPLPDDTFRDAGTMVRTVLVVYDKPARTVDLPLQEARSGPQKAQEPFGEAEPTLGAPRRFKRLSERPRAFRRPKRRVRT